MTDFRGMGLLGLQNLVYVFLAFSIRSVLFKITYVDVQIFRCQDENTAYT